MSNSIERYFVKVGDEFRFLDPVVGTELVPDQPPPSFQDDELMSEGMAHLQMLTRRRRISIDLILAAHGKADHFAQIFAECPDVLPAADAVGVETDWLWNHVDPQPALSSMDLTVSDHAGRRAFQEAQSAWLAEHNKPAIPFEYPERCPSKLGQELDRMIELLRETSNRSDRKFYTILTGAYQTLRQWTFFGMLGFWLARMRDEGLSTEAPLRIAFIVGSYHRALESKFVNYFDIPVTVCAVETAHSFGAHGTLFNDMVSGARVSEAQLRETLL